MEEVEQGYGDSGDMGSTGDSELASQEAPQEQGGDAEAMIAEGVQAYMESQDPEIAHQVMMMLAEAMGIPSGAPAAPAPGGMPPEGSAPAPAGGPPMPMAKNGGKFGFFGNENHASEFQKFVSK